MFVDVVDQVRFHELLAVLLSHFAVKVQLLLTPVVDVLTRAALDLGLQPASPHCLDLHVLAHDVGFFFEVIKIDVLVGCRVVATLAARLLAIGLGFGAPLLALDLVLIVDLFVVFGVLHVVKIAFDVQDFFVQLGLLHILHNSVLDDRYVCYLKDVRALHVLTS